AANDIPKDVLQTRSQSFYEQYVKPRDAEATTARWLSLGRAAALGLLPPLALILLGTVASRVRCKNPNGAQPSCSPKMRQEGLRRTLPGLPELLRSQPHWRKSP